MQTLNYILKPLRQKRTKPHIHLDKAKYDMEYAKTKLKRISLEVPKEKYDEIKQAAEKVEESVNGYIKKAVDERMERDIIAIKISKKESAKKAVQDLAAHVTQNTAKSQNIPNTSQDTPMRETLDEKLKRLRSEHVRTEE